MTTKSSSGDGTYYEPGNFSSWLTGVPPVADYSPGSGNFYTGPGAPTNISGSSAMPVWQEDAPSILAREVSEGLKAGVEWNQGVNNPNAKDSSFLDDPFSYIGKAITDFFDSDNSLNKILGIGEFITKGLAIKGSYENEKALAKATQQYMADTTRLQERALSDQRAFAERQEARANEAREAGLQQAEERRSDLNTLTQRFNSPEYLDQLREQAKVQAQPLIDQIQENYERDLQDFDVQKKQALSQLGSSRHRGTVFDIRRNNVEREFGRRKDIIERNRTNSLSKVTADVEGIAQNIMQQNFARATQLFNSGMSVDQVSNNVRSGNLQQINQAMANNMRMYSQQNQFGQSKFAAIPGTMTKSTPIGLVGGLFEKGGELTKPSAIEEQFTFTKGKLPKDATNKEVFEAMGQIGQPLSLQSVLMKKLLDEEKKQRPDQLKNPLAGTWQ